MENPLEAFRSEFTSGSVFAGIPSEQAGKVPTETTLAPGCIWVPYVQPTGPFKPRKRAPVALASRDE